MYEIYTLAEEMQMNVFRGILVTFGRDLVIPQGPFDTDPPIPG